MFKRIAFASVAALALTTTGYAQGSEQGWEVSFKRDAFDKTIFPEGSVVETGRSAISSASVGVACGGDGSLVPTLWPGAYLSPRTYQVELKAGSTQRKFTFTAGDIPRLGNQLRLQGEDATAFIDLFSKADESVAYRTESKQGRFPSIAARQVFDIVRASCPK